MQRVRSTGCGVSRRDGIQLRLALGFWGLLCALVAGAQPAPDDRSVVVRPGTPGERLGSETVSVRVGGRPAVVTDVVPARGEWEVVVYIDSPLLTPKGLDESIGLLRGRSSRLLELGPVTIVVADPEPSYLLSGARYPHQIEEALSLLEDKTTLAGELLWRRLRFLKEAREGLADEALREGEMRRERALIDRQRQALESFVDGPPPGGPRLLILVQDGFDLDYKRFYLSKTASLAGLETDLRQTQDQLGRTLAARGWTVLGLAAGDQGSELLEPLEPLRSLAEATGGELILGAAALDRALAEWQSALEVRFRGDGLTAGTEALEVANQGEPPRSARWSTSRAFLDAALGSVVAPAVASSVVHLLSPGPGPHTGATRFTAITGDHDVDYVAFFVDDFLTDVARRPPFQARLELASEAAEQQVRAVAFSAEGLELGADALAVNERDEPFRVDIVDVAGDRSRGEVELTATVSTPRGRRLERVDFFWNQELRTSLRSEPFVARVTTPRVDSADYYRVVAHLDDGSSLGTARMADEPGVAERVDINLVELYAMVSGRRRAPLEKLSRDDFAIRHSGAHMTIQGFARAEDVPLTVGLAVDTSESMRDWQDDLRDAAARFFEAALGKRDRAFMIDFDVRARLTQEPTDRQELLVGRMGALDFGGYTSLYDAILFALAQFEGQGGRKALVVLTDGDDYSSTFRPDRCIEEALRLGVPVYMVVLDDPGRAMEDVTRMVVHRLARETGGQAYFFSSKERLDGIYSAIEEELRNQYLLTYAMERPLRAVDLEDIQVEVKDPSLSVRTVLGNQVLSPPAGPSL